MQRNLGKFERVAFPQPHRCIQGQLKKHSFLRQVQQFLEDALFLAFMKSSIAMLIMARQLAKLRKYFCIPFGIARETSFQQPERVRRHDVGMLAYDPVQALGKRTMSVPDGRPSKVLVALHLPHPCLRLFVVQHAGRDRGDARRQRVEQLLVGQWNRVVATVLGHAAMHRPDLALRALLVQQGCGDDPLGKQALKLLPLLLGSLVLIEGYPEPLWKELVDNAQLVPIGSLDDIRHDACIIGSAGEK